MGRGRQLSAGDVRHDIVFDDSPAWTRAGDALEVKAVLSGQPFHQRRGAPTLTRAPCQRSRFRHDISGAIRGDGRFDLSRLRDDYWRGRWSSDAVRNLCFGGGRCRSGFDHGNLAFGTDGRNRRADRHGLTLTNQRLAQNSRIGRFDFERDLIGFDFGDRIADFDLFTNILEPAKKRSFFHAVAHFGHDHCCHYYALR